jgi:anthranilate phosphoribosyltransferase
LARAASAETLDPLEARAAFGALLDGEFEPAQAGVFLCLLAQRGETAAEIAGAAVAMRERMTRFEHDCPTAIDTCGTGGDGLATFNLSTAAAIVAAAAGARVIKHGNRAASSRCGSADLLEAAGVALQLNAQDSRRVFEELGITFLFAPSFHPALKALAPLRRSLGLRTMFNLIGPLANPGCVRRQVLGIPGERWGPAFQSVLSELGHERALVVHGFGQADELTLAGPAQTWTLGMELAQPIDAHALGLARAPIESLTGGDPSTNLRLLHRCFDGETGALSDAVVLNAAAALWVAEVAADLPTGIDQAREALRSGRARNTLARWAELSRQLRGAA